MSQIRNFTLCFVCVLFTTLAVGQERITVSGVEYMVHEVKKGQTLFAISKAYAVPLDDLVSANPSVKGGLNTGQRLLIPVVSIDRKEEKAAPDLTDGELRHEVKKKETLYSIANRYSVDLAHLIERNPSVTDGIKPGMVLTIPLEKVKTSDPGHSELASDQSGRFHTVLPGETLYSIGKIYNVEIDQLKSLNRLDGSNISVGSQIRLPDDEPKTPEVNPDDIPKMLKPSYRIAFLLPFNMDFNDTVLVETDGKELHPLTDIAMQFYFGARMALDSLESDGLRADVDFIDVTGSEISLGAALSSKELADADLVIGPFHKKALVQVADHLSNKDVPVICPVPQSNRIILNRPNVLKVKSGRVEQIEAITTYASKQFTDGNVVIFMPEIEKEKELQRMALKGLQAKMPDIEIHEIHDWAEPDKFKVHFQLHKMNSVVIPSENLSVVSGLLTKLNGIADQHPMTVYGLQKWAEFDNIDLAYKEKLNVHLAMSDWVDRESRSTAKFVRSFRKEHNNDPSDYAFLGYDVTYFFVDQLLRNGIGFQSIMDEGVETLHLPIRMKSTGDDHGLRNVGITLVDHEGMTLNRVTVQSMME